MKNILLFLLLISIYSNSQDTIRFNHVIEIIGEEKRDWDESGYFIFTKDSIEFKSFWTYKNGYLKDTESRYFWRMNKSIWWCQIEEKEVMVRSGYYPYPKLHYIRD